MTPSLGTRRKCRSFLVTSDFPKATAVAAIHRSLAPINRPLVRRYRYNCPYSQHTSARGVEGLGLAARGQVVGLILETTFLIDLERELHRGEQGPAQAFLEEHASEPLFITHSILGELAAGVSVDGRKGWEAFVAPFRTLP